MKIGIPRSLFYYKHPRLWLTFLEELDQEVVLSPPTNRTVVEAAARYGEDESCLAVKLVFGHISYLLDKCDAIFAPAYYGLQPVLEPDAFPITRSGHPRWGGWPLGISHPG